MALAADVISSPVGDLVVMVDDEGRLVAVLFRGNRPVEEVVGDAARDGEALDWDADRCAPVEAQLEAYFRGERRVFDLPLAPRGTTFQRRVWTALMDIPYGSVTSYGDLARRLGDAMSVRAVGRANGANPISIVVPCHRVIGADGSLVGYGGGLAAKRMLLELEGAMLPGMGGAE